MNKQPLTDTALLSLLPKAGSLIWNTGHEFTVCEPRIDTAPDGSKVFRYTGKATGRAVNASIAGTAYDGGTYGWKVGDAPSKRDDASPTPRIDPREVYGEEDDNIDAQTWETLADERRAIADARPLDYDLGNR